MMPLCNSPVLYACNKPRLLWSSYVYFRVKESGVTDVVCLHVVVLWITVWHTVVSFWSSTLGGMKRSLLVSSNGLGDEMTQNEPCQSQDNPLWYFSFTLDGFSWDLSIFWKSVEKVPVKSDKDRVFNVKTRIHFWSRLGPLFLEWKMFQTKFVEKIESHFMLDNLFPPPSEIMWRNIVDPERPQMTI